MDPRLQQLQQLHEHLHAAAAGSATPVQRPPIKARRPFVSADNRPAKPDGKFRVVLVATGSVASVKVPDMVGSLSKDPDIQLQVVATDASLHFHTQQQVDDAVKRAWNLGESTGPGTQPDFGVRVWTDKDEWADWGSIGDPILHIELRRWADLVVVAPCSADVLAKIASGFCDNLAVGLRTAIL
ncbi:uncharacterized protein EHS24_003277 [Apiotrichum porosum]|uniref:Flavoprotein domain-containing protein n=1 Tax=Apiotrichum porosum TaxID=105984 RepID=A0A427XFN3_9TREE|nr:uncharacterized protein EHS24_003277 [Apiotrichum porosum]RSH77710.1 hypothetical protein EHS24_003277 [Apiotrichum porosum]